MQIKIDCTGRGTSTVTDFLVIKMTEMIQSDEISSGIRLPSIRQFSEHNQVSRFTTVQVYDRLVANGLVHSRRGSGFYVADKQIEKTLTDDQVLQSKIVKYAYTDTLEGINAGRGVLPESWLKDAGLDKAIRRVSKNTGSLLLDGYSNIYGYLPFREQVRQRLLGIGVSAGIQQIISVGGVIPGVDLVVRSLLDTDATVFVDEPGYYMLNSILKKMKVKVVGVPWKEKGPDIERLQQLAKLHKPRLYITSAVLHNPTTITLTPAIIHEVLNIAEQENFLLLEDDVFGVFHGEAPLRYATLDQFKRVIYINSYSKTISARLRVGYVVLPEPLVETVIKTRVFAYRTSELAEHVAYELLSDGNYRKYIAHTIERLQRSREQALDVLARLDFEFFHVPEYGQFLWAKLKGLDDSRILSTDAHQHGIHMMPGHHFMTKDQISPWMRLAVPWCLDRQFIQYIENFDGQ